GALLAKAEVEVGINQLLDAMPDLRLADGFDPVEQGVFTRGPQSLPVRFTPVTRLNDTKSPACRRRQGSRGMWQQLRAVAPHSYVQARQILEPAE
ncbi:hypothetical protein ACIP10_37110, partial [Streptomyces galbus]